MGYYQPVVDTGLGNITKAFYDSLKNKYNVEFIDSRNLDSVYDDIKVGDINKNYDILIYTDAIYYPDSRNDLLIKLPNAKIRICYSMFEASEIPLEWVYIINRQFDMVLVPAEYLIDVYENCGVNKKILLLEPGIRGIEKFINYKNEIKLNNNKFVFCYSSYFFERKNHLAVLKSFYNAFSNSQNFKLILHGKFGETKVLKCLKDFIEDKSITNVEILDKYLDRDAYFDLIVKSNCYVSVSMGEGFSITPRESIAAGVPTIVSDSIAQKNLAETGIFKFVEGLIPVQADYKLYFKRNIGYCYDILIDDLSQAFIDLYTNYEFYFYKASHERNLMQKYSQKTFEQRLKKLIDTLLINN